MVHVDILLICGSRSVKPYKVCDWFCSLLLFFFFLLEWQQHCPFGCSVYLVWKYIVFVDISRIFYVIMHTYFYNAFARLFRSACVSWKYTGYLCAKGEKDTNQKQNKKNGVKINRKSQAMWRANKKRPKPHNTKAMKNNNEIEAKQFGVSSNRRAEKKTRNRRGRLQNKMQQRQPNHIV